MKLKPDWFLVGMVAATALAWASHWNDLAMADVLLKAAAVVRAGVAVGLGVGS